LIRLLAFLVRHAVVIMFAELTREASMSIAEVASVSKSTSVEGLPFPRLWTGR
jgi:hypothetical protein